jgi:predicted PurR-regulated permease PerM
MAQYGGLDMEKSVTPNKVAKQRKARRLLTPAAEEVLEAYFNQFDDDGGGDLAQSEIINLMIRLNVVSDKLKAIELMERMDENNDGSVDMDEFLDAMDQVVEWGIMTQDAFDTMVETRVKFGFAGTTWRMQANVIWIMNAGVMIMTTTVVLCLLIYFAFILIPLTMAYLGTFLLGPLMDFLYQRPLIVCKKVICAEDHYTPQEAKHEWSKAHGDALLPTKRDGSMDHTHKDFPIKSRQFNAIPWRDGESPGSEKCRALQIVGSECVQWGKVPFVCALLLTLIIAASVLGGVIYFSLVQMHELGDDEAFMDEVYRMRDDFNKDAQTDGYIITDFQKQQTVPSILYLVINGKNHSSVKHSITKPDTLNHITIAELLKQFAPIVNLINDVTLTLLLCLYMLGARKLRVPDDLYREMYNPHTQSVLEKIETSIRNYILLKTQLSLLTGVLVAFFQGPFLYVLEGQSLRLWFVWGVLSFVLNFIPTVGSLIAMLLPLPVIAVQTMSGWAKVLAFCLPAAVQGYVGNVLEPQLFGASLNLTAISVLIGLVFWGSIWGLAGAILSVPLLGAQKIILTSTDFPLAKRLLYLMKEDNSLEDSVAGIGKEKKDDGANGESNTSANSAPAPTARPLHMSNGQHQAQDNPLAAEGHRPAYGSTKPSYGPPMVQNQPMSPMARPGGASPPLMASYNGGQPQADSGQPQYSSAVLRPSRGPPPQPGEDRSNQSGRVEI